MSKWMAVVALGMAMVCGCDMFKKKDKETTSEPKKMSISAEKGAACDTSAAKAK